MAVCSCSCITCSFPECVSDAGFREDLSVLGWWVVFFFVFLQNLLADPNVLYTIHRQSGNCIGVVIGIVYSVGVTNVNTVWRAICTGVIRFKCSRAPMQLPHLGKL